MFWAKTSGKKADRAFARSASKGRLFLQARGGLARIRAGERDGHKRTRKFIGLDRVDKIAKLTANLRDNREREKSAPCLRPESTDRGAPSRVGPRRRKVVRTSVPLRPKFAADFCIDVAFHTLSKTRREFYVDATSDTGPE